MQGHGDIQTAQIHASELKLIKRRRGTDTRQFWHARIQPGNVDQFSWKAVGQAAIGGALTAGVGAGVQKLAEGSSMFAKAASELGKSQRVWTRQWGRRQWGQF